MISTYIRQSQHAFRQWGLDPRVHRLLRGAAHVLAGFCLSAASLEQGMLPLVSGLVWACRGWRAVMVAAGGFVGYPLFWGNGSLQGILWTVLALLGALLLGDRKVSRELPLLIPAVGMLTVSGLGLGFQILAADTTAVPLYLIRVALGGASPWIFGRWLQQREPVLEWLCWGMFTLGLAQITPFPWLGLGFAAAGAAAALGTFPCAAVVGLALDMAGITPVPMAAVTTLSFFLRFLPRYPAWAVRVAPGCVGLFLMYVSGRWDMHVLPGLFLGGIAAGCFSGKQPIRLRRGETGVAQVRLEMAAETLTNTGQLLQEQSERFVDTDGLVLRAVNEACAGCSARSHCRDARRLQQMPGELLRKPLLVVEELPIRCKKGNRVLAELRRAQEQLRTIQADRQRQQEYRAAVVQQYLFLGDFLRKLSDRLAERIDPGQTQYRPAVFAYGNHSTEGNGDRCLEFAGVQNKYYILLCDGMGTGPGAIREGNTAGTLLYRMLSCGFPAEYALESLNSICALRERAGAVTVDLVEVQLDTGKITLRKWGAAPSYLIEPDKVEKLGTTTLPPGVSVSDPRKLVSSFTMKKGQSLLLVSDGLDEARVLELCRSQKEHSPAMLAQMLLKEASPEDDATVVTVQLLPEKK